VLGKTKVTLAKLLDIKNQSSSNSLLNPLPHPSYSTANDKPIQKPQAISVKQGKRNEHVSGRRVFCPHGHITLASLSECQHCGEKIE